MIVPLATAIRLIEWRHAVDRAAALDRLADEADVQQRRYRDGHEQDARLARYRRGLSVLDWTPPEPPPYPYRHRCACGAGTDTVTKAGPACARCLRAAAEAIRAEVRGAA